MKNFLSISKNILTIVIFLAGVLELSFPGDGYGQDNPPLNFQPVQAAKILFSCGMAGIPDQGCAENMAAQSGSGSKPNPGFSDGGGQYLVEVIGGFWHQIILDPANGFAQEVFICCANAGSTPGGIRSPSEGQNVARFMPLLGDSKITGNGTGDPEKIIIRTLIQDQDINFDFVKDQFSKKPKMTLTIDDTAQNMSSNFAIDMSASGYQDMNTPATITNTMTITDPGMPDAGASNFDMASDAQSSTVTGGQFKVVDPSNWDYVYISGSGFNVQDQDWLLYWNDFTGSYPQP